VEAPRSNYLQRSSTTRSALGEKAGLEPPGFPPLPALPDHLLMTTEAPALDYQGLLNSATCSAE
jgi:hypothetical protein